MKRADFTNDPDLSLFQRGAGVGTYCFAEDKPVQVVVANPESVKVIDMIPDSHGWWSRCGNETQRWVLRGLIQPLKEKDHDTEARGQTEATSADS